METRFYSWLWFVSVLAIVSVFLVRGNEGYQGSVSQSSLFPNDLVNLFLPSDELTLQCDSDPGPMFVGSGQSLRLHWTATGVGLRGKPLSLNLESESEDTFDLGELTQDGPMDATYRAPVNVEAEMSLHIVASVIGGSVKPAACPIRLVP